MLKKIMFAVAPLCLFVTTAFAGGDILDEVASLDADSISSADISIEEFSLDLDVDALTADVENADDAIEACYRRFYRSYRSYGCGHGYRHSYYRPCYSRYYSYRPVYSYCYTPVYYNYWGCY